MSGTTPALIAAAAGVGFGHAIMPDHWVPLAVVGRTQRYPLGRVARLSGLAGVAHVMVSLLLGGVIVVVGLQFRSSIEHAQNAIVGGVLLATGIAFGALELAGRGHGHGHRHGHDHPHHHHHHHHDGAAGHGHRDDHPDPSPIHRLAAVMVPFGAAASPDLTILPVFLAAAAAGTGTAIGSLFAFSLVTITTIVVLTLIATLGGYQVRGKWLERWGTAVTAAVLLIIGALILAGVL